MMSPQERSHPVLPGTPAAAEPRYCNPVDSNTDEAAVYNQLVDMPEFWEVFNNPNFSSLVPGNLDITASAFANVDMNFNQNSGFLQDFSHYSDLQFNMLVSESQNPQLEPQDSTVQVKTEEEL